jgi:hypothetical protein
MTRRTQSGPEPANKNLLTAARRLNEHSFSGDIGIRPGARATVFTASVRLGAIALR